MSGFLLDTNVISELIRPKPQPKVTVWIDATDEELSKNKLQPPAFEWVAQVSLLRPGFFPQMGASPKHPGLKSETWATHSRFPRAIFLFSNFPLS